MRNFQQTGLVLTLTAPSGGVVSSGGYQIGQLFVVAAGDVAEGEPFEGQTSGVFTLPKTTGQTWSEGTLLYWDSSESKVTTTAAGNLLIGAATASATTGATSGPVRLSGAPDVSSITLESDVVDTAAIQDDAVTTDKIADGAVTFAKAAVFISAETTGTGSAQNVAHGLGVEPAGVLVTLTEFADSASVDVEEGTHTDTNVVLTVTSGVKFKVMAWA